MKTPDIRQRMLLAALLPVSLLSVLLSVVFLMARFEDITETYQLRTRSVARQLALASEFGLFAGNQQQLQTLALGALREPDVRWVAILDRQGKTLVSSGETRGEEPLPFSSFEKQVFDAQRLLDVLAQPVFASGIKLDDLYEDANKLEPGQAIPLGQVVVQFSRQSMIEQKRDILWLGGLISALGLLFGIVLAVRLSAGVIRPMMRVSHLIERIGNGDFSAASRIQAQTPDRDPLHDLQENLIQMADRLAEVQQSLEQQVSTVTQALREKKEEAERATEAKSRFLAAASHDLRQPVHALGMFVARLAQLPHDGQTSQLIGNLEASVRAMQSLLDGLLDISRLEAKAVQIRFKKFPLQDLFDRLAQDMAPLAQDKCLQLRIRPCQIWVRSDPALLYRILLNLVGNALRYTEKGKVLVACRHTGVSAQATIEVWDSGLGIAPEHQEAVFKEFYQVNNPARQRRQGLGLGLNIVQRSCQLLLHPLTLSSRLGVGTRFQVKVPKEAPELVPLAPVTPEQPTRDGLTGTVLVIEDDDLVRQALVDLLKSWGWMVAEARDLKSAMELIQGGVLPGLIISDYRLDDTLNGILVITQLRQQLAHPIPACLISGDTDTALIQAAQAAQLTLLHKPVRPAKLRSLLRHLLMDQRDRAGEA
ncbi:ATP-binding protein [Rhodoferax sp.]|uniref:hybrid sensor histidine kinase/response regulator n=1 Tax=Rhodoferax sp. TaxID=50421 RepID=UPI0025D08BF6|nr:ATP-binding protein [Rhodoferax sp.]MCM2297573.1 ATP-binding protein [Rhodoferax sp.]